MWHQRRGQDQKGISANVIAEALHGVVGLGGDLVGLLPTPLNYTTKGGSWPLRTNHDMALCLLPGVWRLYPSCDGKSRWEQTHDQYLSGIYYILIGDDEQSYGIRERGLPCLWDSCRDLLTCRYGSTMWASARSLL